VASDRFSDELERWLDSDADKTLDGLFDVAGLRRRRFLEALTRTVRRLERYSRPRLPSSSGAVSATSPSALS
jgi:hypothetical protein